MMQAIMLQKCLYSQVQKGIYIPIWEKKGTIKGNKYVGNCKGSGENYS